MTKTITAWAAVVAFALTFSDSSQGQTPTPRQTEIIEAVFEPCYQDVADDLVRKKPEFAGLDLLPDVRQRMLTSGMAYQSGIALRSIEREVQGKTYVERMAAYAVYRKICFQVGRLVMIEYRL